MPSTACTGDDRPGRGGKRHIEAAELCDRARHALEEKKAQDLVLLDVRKLSSVTDYFLIATGTSAPHLKALTEEVEVPLKKAGVKRFSHSGTPESGWVVIDYVDVVIHIFSAEARRYYDLEKLWSDAVVVT